MRKTIIEIQQAKGQDKLVVLTAYSAPMAGLLDPSCDILLVGDSMGMVLYGMENTLGVTLDMMVAHGRAVVRGSKKALVVVDMPYGTYEKSPEQALINAKKIMECGCDAVKIEGHEDKVAYLVDNGIPVMAHIGLLPQSVEIEGGYKIKGKTEAEQKRLIAEAQAVQAAGAFAVVIEGTIEPVARSITEALSIPTIGIGASHACDGQVLVSEDMLGMFESTPRFVKTYASLRTDITKAVQHYAQEVRDGKFPSDSYVYK